MRKITKDDIETLKGLRVVIKNINTDEPLTEGIISEHIKHIGIVNVKAPQNDELKQQKVAKLVIYAQGVLVEYLGNQKKALGNQDIEFAIFRGETKDYRKSARYYINAQGYIDAIIITGQQITLNKPLDVIIDNVSMGGVMVLSQPNCFNLGDVICLSYKDLEEGKVFLCQVVRKRDKNMCETEYGCEILG